MKIALNPWNKTYNSQCLLDVKKQKKTKDFRMQSVY
jgi:hypothetical protein